MIVDGEPVTVEVTSEPEGVTLSGEGFVVSLAPTDGAGETVRVGADGVIEVPASGGLQTQADGYCTLCTIDVYWLWENAQAPRTIRSSAVAFPVGSVTTSETGTVTTSLQLPTGLPLGDGVLQILGQDPHGASRVLNVGMRITSDPVATPPKGAISITAKRGKGQKAHIITIRGIVTGAEAARATIRISVSPWTRARVVERSVAVTPTGEFTAQVKSRAAVRITATAGDVSSTMVTIRAVRK